MIKYLNDKILKISIPHEVSIIQEQAINSAKWVVFLPYHAVQRSCIGTWQFLSEHYSK